MSITRRREYLFKARELYIATGITNNITEALRMFMETVSADEQEPVVISSKYVHKINEELRENVDRSPQCDECGDRLSMAINVIDANGNEFPTAWKCKRCEKIYYSDKTSKEWWEMIRENRKL